MRREGVFKLVCESVCNEQLDDSGPALRCERVVELLEGLVKGLHETMCRQALLRVGIEVQTLLESRHCRRRRAGTVRKQEVGEAEDLHEQSRGGRR